MAYNYPCMATTLTEAVAADVRAELARASITAPVAAKHLGMSRSTLYRCLRGTRPFTIEQLGQLADLLDVSVATFLPEKGLAA